MTAHRHQFVKAGEVEKMRQGASSSYGSLFGYMYVCIDIECDAARKVWSDGTKEIVREGLLEER